jgi:hypothetical protein
MEVAIQAQEISLNAQFTVPPSLASVTAHPSLALLMEVESQIKALALALVQQLVMLLDIRAQELLLLARLMVPPSPPSLVAAPINVMQLLLAPAIHLVQLKE